MKGMMLYLFLVRGLVFSNSISLCLHTGRTNQDVTKPSEKQSVTLERPMPDPHSNIVVVSSMAHDGDLGNDNDGGQQWLWRRTASSLLRKGKGERQTTKIEKNGKMMKEKLFIGLRL
ncbi:Uncharacterized protein TCM_026381 [Theobroma cacao]|uniref:Secreted protein n=1 Tax=Theobroma cacao TaxID=3641 RepID=A0A061F350_THECC|nr:Uncharacterized protein TCM_026381 [Theobroma cacao]